MSCIKISLFMFIAWSEIKYLVTKELLSLILTTKLSLIVFHSQCDQIGDI